MTKKKTNKIDEGFLDALIGDYGAAGLRSMFKKGMTREAQLAQDLFIKDFVADATSSLSAGIQGGFVDPNIRGGTTAVEPEADADTMAVKTAKSRTSTQPAGTPGSAPAPSASAAPKPTNISGSFTQKGAPAQAQQNVNVPAQNVKFNMNTPGARTTPKVAPKTYPQPGTTRDIKAANRVPDDISESAHYKKLNAIFESIFEATGGKSIAAYMNDWFKKYMGGVNWQSHKDQVEAIIQNVEDTYGKDKGVKALRQLAQAAFAIVKVAGVEPEGAKDIEKPADSKQSNQPGGEQGSQQANKNLPTLEEITSALANMQVKDLTALQDAVEAEINKKKKAASGDQTQYMGKVAPNARAATKPANPLVSPTVPSRGTVKSTGTGTGGVTSGGAGALTRESRRPRR